MKLLFDANLSPKLVARLADLFPWSRHVFDTGLVRSIPDEVIFDYARDNDLTVVSADSDFLNIVARRGPPPQVVRLENCNYRTAQVEELLRRNVLRLVDLSRSERPSLILRRS